MKGTNGPTRPGEDPRAELFAVLFRMTLIRVARTYGLRVTLLSRRDEATAALLQSPAVEYGEDLIRRFRREELDRAVRRMAIAGRTRTKAELIRTLLERVPLPRTGGSSRWRSFADAREFARSLFLLDSAEWSAYSRGDLRHTKGLRPPDIPAIPGKVYRGQGWCGIRDWLGPAPEISEDPRFAPFRKARRFAWRLGLESDREWRDWCRGRLTDRPARPEEIPKQPQKAYPLAWRGWDDWLGTCRTRPRGGGKYRPFLEAREFARSLGLPRLSEWHRYCRRGIRGLPPLPSDIPAAPNVIYRSLGFRGIDDWLGNEWPRRRKWRPFLEAREFARGLGIIDVAGWWEYTRGNRPDLPPRPDDLPAAACDVYREQGWVSWGDFLDTGTVAPVDRVYRPFDEAREFARSLGLRSSIEWIEWSKGNMPELGRRPDDVPSTPYVPYRDQGWRGWGDFLGTGHVAPGRREFRSFRRAREFARTLGLRTAEDWRAWRRGDRPGLPETPDDIPADVRQYYDGKGWTHWPDFLGCDRPPRRRRPR